MKKDYIWIGIICIIMGIMLSQQGKLIQRNVLEGMSPREKSSELAAEFQKVQDEKKELIEHINVLEQKLADIQDSAANENVLIQSLNDELKSYKQFAGLTDVKGSGVIINIDNPPVDMNYTYDVNFVYDYEMLLSLINELNSAGAEAISINSQRITAMSEIRTAGNAININMIPQKIPFEIKAIGNADTLEGALNQRFGIISRLRDKRYLVEVHKSNDIKIEKFGGVYTFKYAREME